MLAQDDHPTLSRTPSPHRSELDVTHLVEAARAGDETAWHGLVERLQPLVHGIARGFRLQERDVEDVAQTVWLRMVEHLERIREPKALPKWAMTTARNEAIRIARGRARILSIDVLADAGSEPPAQGCGIDVGLLRSEEAQIVRRGLAELPPAQRELLLLLSAEPPLPYREISRILGIPIGSIGPTRARGLARLRRTTAMRTYVDSRCQRPRGAGAA